MILIIVLAKCTNGEYSSKLTRLGHIQLRFTYCTDSWLVYGFSVYSVNDEKLVTDLKSWHVKSV